MSAGPPELARAALGLWVAACALFGLASDAVAQTVPRRDPRGARHLEAVHAERFAALHRAVEASADGGERARALLSRPAPLLWPDRAELDALRRELLAPTDAAPDALAAFADALDLQAVPSAWTAGGERGPVLTVRVAQLASGPGPLRATIRLYWLDGRGGEELARTLEFERSALLDPGFDLFVRAPAEPGVHRLQLEIETDAGRARGVPVELFAVPELDARLAAVDPEALDRPRRRLFEELEGLVRLGLRQPYGLDPGRALAALEGRPEGVPLSWVDVDGTLGPHALGSFGGNGPVVAVIAPHDVAPDGLFLGPRGERWRTVIDEHDALVVPIGPERGEPLGPLLEALHRLAGERPLVLVPRPSRVVELFPLIDVERERGTLFLFQAVGPAPPFGGELPGAVLGVDTLDDGARAVALGGSRSPLANELELGRRLAAWWSGRER